MIDSKCVKIITHLSKPLLPPGKSGFFHFLPIIGWETPILSGYSKIIWWRTSLKVQIK